MSDWYYAAGDQRVGPVSLDQLKQLAAAGAITPATFVWTAGAAQWVPAGSVAALFAPAYAGTATAAPQGGMLAYASSSLVDGSVAPRPFAPPPDDPGPYHKLGTMFTVGKQRWQGRASVTPRAIYLWKISRPNTAAYGIGGLAGVAIAAATTGADDLTRSCDITELPPTIRAHFDPKGKRKKGDIIVLNKDALNLVQTTGWSRAITPHVGPEKFPITCRMFGLNKARQFMRDHGWTLDLTVEPTAAPSHGRAYGLDEETARKRAGKSLWLRILYLIIGIAVFILAVLVRLAAHR